MSNKHDANVRKSMLVNFQLGLIVALLTTILVMNIKTAIPEYANSNIASEEVSIETYYNPEFIIEKVEEPITEEKKVKPPTLKDVYVSKPDDAVESILKKAVLATAPNLAKPSTLIPEPKDDFVEPQPFIKVEQVPIFPGCENLDSNDDRRTCMTKRINKIIQRKFNKDLASDLGLSGKQVIYVRFSINKDGQVAKVKSRATHPKLKEEGERMATYIPAMQPGRQRDNPVEVIFDLPIIFEVQ